MIDLKVLCQGWKQMLSIDTSIDIRFKKYCNVTWYIFLYIISLDNTNNTNKSNLVLKVQSLEKQLSQMKSELDKTKESNRQLLELVQNQNKDTRLVTQNKL